MGDAAPFHVDVAARVATITIDHPPINLMTVPMFLGLADAAERLSADADVCAVLLRSANPEWFIAHFDVEAILDFPVPESRDESVAPGTQELNAFHRMCETFRTMPKPTIAVIEGRVGGGGSELALSCDMRYASPGAVFSQPEVALGIIPGGSGTIRLPRLIGRGRALEVILGCDEIDAATAERWGWVDRMLDDAERWPFVERLARRIASFPPHAVAAAKASVLRADGGLRADLLAEGAAFSETLGEPVTRRAMERFLELGGQTPAGERRLGELVGELTEPRDR